MATREIMTMLAVGPSGRGMEIDAFNGDESDRLDVAGGEPVRGSES